MFLFVTHREAFAARGRAAGTRLHGGTRASAAGEPTSRAEIAARGPEEATGSLSPGRVGREEAGEGRPQSGGRGGGVHKLRAPQPRSAEVSATGAQGAPAPAIVAGPCGRRLRAGPSPRTPQPAWPAPGAAAAGTRTSCRRGRVHPGGRPPAAVIVRRAPPTSAVPAASGPGCGLRAAGLARARRRWRARGPPRAAGARARQAAADRGPSHQRWRGAEGGRSRRVGGERAPGRRGRLDARPERHSRGEQRRRAGGGRVPAPRLLRPAPRSPQLLRPRRDQPPPRLASGKCGTPPPLPGPGPGPRQGEPGHSLGTAENHSPLQRPSRDLRPRARPRPARSAREAGAQRGGPQAGPRRPAQKPCLTWACGQSRSPSCTTKPSAGRRATAEWRGMVPGEWNAEGRRQAHPRSQQQMAGDPWHRFLRSLWEARLGLRRRVENVLQRHLPRRHPHFGLLA